MKLKFKLNIILLLLLVALSSPIEIDQDTLMNLVKMMAKNKIKLKPNNNPSIPPLIQEKKNSQNDLDIERQNKQRELMKKQKEEELNKNKRRKEDVVIYLQNIKKTIGSFRRQLQDLDDKTNLILNLYTYTHTQDSNMLKQGSSERQRTNEEFNTKFNTEKINISGFESNNLLNNIQEKNSEFGLLSKFSQLQTKVEPSKSSSSSNKNLNNLLSSLNEQQNKKANSHDNMSINGTQSKPKATRVQTKKQEISKKKQSYSSLFSNFKSMFPSDTDNDITNSTQDFKTPTSKPSEMELKLKEFLNASKSKSNKEIKQNTISNVNKVNIKVQNKALDNLSKLSNLSNLSNLNNLSKLSNLNNLSSLKNKALSSNISDLLKKAIAAKNKNNITSNSSSLVKEEQQEKKNLNKNQEFALLNDIIQPKDNNKFKNDIERYKPKEDLQEKKKTLKGVKKSDPNSLQNILAMLSKKQSEMTSGIQREEKSMISIDDSSENDVEKQVKLIKQLNLR